MNIIQWISGSIRNKMLLITGSGTTLLLCSALLGIWMSWQGITHLREDAVLHLEAEKQLVDIEKHLGKEIQEWKNLLLRGGQDAAALEKHWNGVQAQEKQVQEKAAALKKNSEDGNLKAKVDAFAQAHQAMGNQYRNAYQTYVGSQFDSAAADRLAMGADNEATRILDEVAGEISARARHANDDAVGKALRAIEITLVMMGGAILIAFVVFLTSLQHGIIRPARSLVDDLNRLATGDFSRPVAQTTRDEIGQVAQSAEKIRSDLGAVVDNVKSASSTVSTSAMALAAASGQVLSGSSRQSEAAAATAAAVEQMTVSIQSVADNAEEVRKLAHNSLQNTAEGKQRLEELARQIDRTVSAMQDIAQSVEQFVSSTASITTMTQQVKDIADQTNLLALNASIEAARAGEQGRGFAVVADEVRKLAEKSAQSANEIDGVTRLLESQSQQASRALTQGQQLLRTSQDSMSDAATAMAATFDAMQQSSQGVDAISDSVREQTSASNEIARNVERIANMAEENNSSITHTSEAARQLQQLAAELQAAVEKFRL